MKAIAKRLDAHFAACAAAAAGVAMVGGVEQAEAAVVWSGAVNIAIPSTTQGVYLNVVTGQNQTSGSFAGYDVNPWSSTGLNMFTPTPNPGGGTSVGTGSTYFNLAQGTLISAASTYSNTGTATINAGTPLNLNSSNNLIGFRFINEANGNQIHYGWMRISLGSTAQAQPRAIVEYAYESVAGVGLQAGVVPAPGALALLGLAGVVGTRRRRHN